MGERQSTKTKKEKENVRSRNEKENAKAHIKYTEPRKYKKPKWKQNNSAILSIYYLNTFGFCVR